MDDRSTYRGRNDDRRVLDSDVPLTSPGVTPRTTATNPPIISTPATTTPVGEPIPEYATRRDEPIVGRTVTDRGVSPPGAEVEPPVGERRFSVGATFLGWAVASFFSLVFLALVAGFLGGNALAEYYGGDTTIDQADVTAYGMGALVGILVATFLAFLIGGYAAGRISLWSGTMHGALIVIWPILFGVLGVIVGAALGDELLAATGVNFDLANMGDLTGGAVLGIVGTLIAMLAGGALGGRFGERYHERGYGMQRRRAYARGRTF